MHICGERGHITVYNCDTGYHSRENSSHNIFSCPPDIIAQTLSTGEKIKSLANLTCNINLAVNFSCSMSPKRPTWIEWDVKPCSIHPPQRFLTCCSSRQRISTRMEKLLTGKTVLHCSTQEKRGNSSLRG